MDSENYSLHVEIKAALGFTVEYYNFMPSLSINDLELICGMRKEVGLSEIQYSGISPGYSLYPGTKGWN